MLNLSKLDNENNNLLRVQLKCADSSLAMEISSPTLFLSEHVRAEKWPCMNVIYKHKMSK